MLMVVHLCVVNMFDILSLHQKIIHFPIAFLSIYPFLELYSLFNKSEFIKKLIFVFISLGLFGLLFAIFSGNYSLNFYDNISINHWDIINQHINYSTYTTLLTSILFLYRIYLFKKNELFLFKVIIIILSFLLLYLIIKTGQYGNLTSNVIPN